jgi:DNA repair protein RecO (recombination protein O)
MPIYKTRGIIIKRTNVGEADKIVTIFSENHGKLKVVARGIRKIRSKLAGNLELFCLSNFNIAEGKNLDVVTAALIEKCYFNIRNNLEATEQAQYFSEVIYKITEENDKHPQIYHLLDHVLESLASEKNKIIIPYFEWNIITELGYHPELYSCINCRSKLTDKEKIFFNYLRGGIVCEKCRKTDPQISTSTIKLLRLFLKHHLPDFTDKLTIDEATLKETQRITRNYLNFKSEKIFRAQKNIFIDK